MGRCRAACFNGCSDSPNRSWHERRARLHAAGSSKKGICHDLRSGGLQRNPEKRARFLHSLYRPKQSNIQFHLYEDRIPTGLRLCTIYLLECQSSMKCGESTQTGVSDSTPCATKAGKEALCLRVTHLNQDIDRRRPWEALKEGDTSAVREELNEWLSDLRNIAYWLAPFLPTSAAAIAQIVSTDPLAACSPLFPRTRRQSRSS